MRYRRGDSLLDRAARLLFDRSKRISVLIAVSYLAATAGLAITLVGGFDGPTGDAIAVGLVLLFVSFATLFYVSISLVAIQTE